MDDIEIQERIKKDEGYRPYVYFDTKGIPTGGYGHAFLPHSTIPHEIAEMFFERDYAEAARLYEEFIKKNGLFYLSSTRRGVIINMIFQMGCGGVSGFREMIKALKKKDYEKAADEMLDSQWARNHKARSGRLAKMMRDG